MGKQSNKFAAHKSECRHNGNHDLILKSSSNGGSTGLKVNQLYYWPKITDGYLVKRTNWINWDTLDKEIYSNQPVHGKKMYWNYSPLRDP